MISNPRMNQEASELVRKIEEGSQETKRVAANSLWETSRAVGGYIHAREALKRLKGLPYNAKHLETGKLNPDYNFPAIDINSILNEEGIWHYQDDPRFSMDQKYPEALVSAVSPINTYHIAQMEYYWAARAIPRDKKRMEGLHDVLERKGKDLTNVQHYLYDEGRKLNDGTAHYLDDETFLRTAVITARMNLEGVFAKHQAKIDSHNELRTAKERGIALENIPFWTEDMTEAEFTTGIIRHLYAPIVSEAVPGEDKPYDFAFVDKKYLEEATK